MIGRLKALLDLPVLFDFYQAAVGANYAKRIFAEESVCAAPGARVLDIGCGTGAVIPFLPQSTDITAIDISADYIAAAHSQYGKRAAFRVADAADVDIDLGGSFDVAYAFGVFHHMPDDVAIRLLNGAMMRLRPGGYFVSIDPTLIEGQGRVSRFFVTSDRGKFIRTPEQMVKLFEPYGVTTDIRTDLLRIPYAQVVMRATKSVSPAC